MTSTEREFVRIEMNGAVATIRLDRPKMNALNRQMQEEIASAAREVAQRDDVRAVIVYGGQRVFAAGADVKEMAQWDYQRALVEAPYLQAAFTEVARIPQPTIAAVTGYALGGGCELALTCDLRIAAEDAKIGQPEILLGVIPGAGGTQRLSRLVGPSRAKELCFTGRFVDADECLRIGLVDRVVPAESVYDEAMALAQQLANGAQFALRAVKRSIDEGLEVDLQTGLAIERIHFAALFGTEDRTIGMNSFVENGAGKAEFTGR